MNKQIDEALNREADKAEDDEINLNLMKEKLAALEKECEDLKKKIRSAFYYRPR